MVFPRHFTVVLFATALSKAPTIARRTEDWRIGLVWSAGRHKAPQPERNARVKERSPRGDLLCELAQDVSQSHRKPAGQHAARRPR